MVFKCKMCGGDLHINEEESVATCEYCGTLQTLPKLSDDKRMNLYDRANHFRRNNEYDKAVNIYEQILNEDNSDAEAYWSLVLCHYGIEYVEDPSSHRRVPTVNRTQYTSVFADENYKEALAHADASQREIYEREAHAIDEIQKGILEISNQEEPFDVFICYKETDAAGRRTPDSVLATELYHELTKEGFKVFFSRITLEDKLGTAYEPYIFAALNSARVMVVVGTKAEYFSAVWVKNEWSRYLALIEQSAGKKMLIPAYRDMDPYDLPEEFSHLQAQDMSKLGFMQDLIHGVKKILSAGEPETVEKKAVVVSEGMAGNVGESSLTERAFLFLEDGEWEKANEYCERVLDMNPKNAEAYLGKLMAELQVNHREDLKYCKEVFDDWNSYQKAYRFGTEELKKELSEDIEYIKESQKIEQKTQKYNSAIQQMQQAESEEDYGVAARMFSEIEDFRDAAEKLRQCEEEGKKAGENAKKNAILEEGINLKKQDTIPSLKQAVEIFRSIPGWENADFLAVKCEEQIKKLEKIEEENGRNTPILEKGLQLKMDDNVSSLKEAVKVFRSISGWKNADKLMEECQNRIEELKAKKLGLWILIAVVIAVIVIAVLADSVI